MISGPCRQRPRRTNLQSVARALRAHVHDEARFLLHLGQDAEPAEDKGAPLFSVGELLDMMSALEGGGGQGKANVVREIA